MQTNMQELSLLVELTVNYENSELTTKHGHQTHENPSNYVYCFTDKSV